MAQTEPNIQNEVDARFCIKISFNHGSGAWLWSDAGCRIRILALRDAALCSCCIFFFLFFASLAVHDASVATGNASSYQTRKFELRRTTIATACSPIPISILKQKKTLQRMYHRRSPGVTAASPISPSIGLRPPKEAHGAGPSEPAVPCWLLADTAIPGRNPDTPPSRG